MPNRHEGVIKEPHLQYTHVDERRKRRLTLDLYRPSKGEAAHPAIVMFYGGGWMNGRPGLFAALAQALTQRGYVCVVPQYRLSGEKPFPAAVHDCKAAIRWTRKNAKRYNIDQGRIAAMGGSAGGHLAGFMASSNGVKRFEGKGDHQSISSDVQAAVVMCGAMNLLEPFIVERLEKAAGTLRSDAVIDFMGGALPNQKPGIYQEASPATHVSKRTPPMLFIDGELDKPGLRYASIWPRLDELKIPYEFIKMPKAPHPFWGMREWFIPTVDAADAFLKKHLR
ncbi:MAG: alpha/beta hydrolase [Verrucomicrobiota bacterium]|jgi:pectinesterase|nr:alpha/beta hydrolase [Verrucomicrobiota bacterium]